MNTSIIRHQGIVIIESTGTLDSGKSVEFAATMNLVLEENVRRLLLDFSEVIYVSSAGLRVISVALKRQKQIGGELALCGLNHDVHRIFELTGFSRLVQVFATRQEALLAWEATVH